jgi:putative transcriptional regulator
MAAATPTALSSHYLTGQCLVAMPTMDDPFFSKTVIYLCSHSAEGAFGIVLNRAKEFISFTEVLQQLDITPTESAYADIIVHSGGPVEGNRGFVLHSDDYCTDSTTPVGNTLCLTATQDILHAIAEGRGPAHILAALGCAQWGAGQLEKELMENVWLTVPAELEMIFDLDLEAKWGVAISSLGIDPGMLTQTIGHA